LPVSTTFTRSKKKTSAKWVGIGISQPNQRSSKYYVMKIFASNFTDRFITGVIIEKKCKIKSKRVAKGLRDLLLNFWDPLDISGTVKARNFKFGTHKTILWFSSMDDE